jgi:mRNA interferase RelE/StbE
MYKVVFTKRALKDLENIDKKMQNRIGDYRVIFDIDGENIVILRIGHRRDIYNA